MSNLSTKESGKNIFFCFSDGGPTCSKFVVQQGNESSDDSEEMYEKLISFFQ